MSSNYYVQKPRVLLSGVCAAATGVLTQRYTARKLRTFYIVRKLRS